MERRKSESVEHMCFFNSFKRLSASCANECCSRHNWRVTRPIAPCWFALPIALSQAQRASTRSALYLLV